MKPEKTGVVTLVFFLSMGFFLLGGEEKSNTKEPEKEEAKSLIKKGLLMKKRGELGPSLRNIFSPKNSINHLVKKQDAWFPTNPQENVSVSEGKASRLTVNIKYIGYVISKEKIIALIIFRENVLAVEKGEMIDVNLQVGEITTEEIEIIIADTEKKRYSLEEERQ